MMIAPYNFVAPIRPAPVLYVYFVTAFELILKPKSVQIRLEHLLTD